MEQAISFFGLLVMLGIAYLLSENRKKISLRAVLGGLGLQFALALFILKTPYGQKFFEGARVIVQMVISLSDQGARFMFGENFEEHLFAFKVLPTIIFVSALSYVLFHLGVLQRIVQLLAKIMVKVMNVSGSESLCAAANVFIGQTESPMLIRPYLNTMTRSEILTMMCSGMATVAGGVLAAYVSFGIPAGHLLSASLMSAPAAILIAKILIPETQVSPTMGSVKLKAGSDSTNLLEAACNGAADGLKLALNVAAMLIAFISLVALVNLILKGISDPFGWNLSLEYLLSWIFRPLAWVMGVPWNESLTVGQLLGEKVVINEFYAYLNMSKAMEAGQMSVRTINITTYALCGFANFSSIAIQVGGIGSLCPERKQDLARVGFKAFIGGNLAAFMTACIAGMLM